MSDSRRDPRHFNYVEEFQLDPPEPPRNWWRVVFVAAGIVLAGWLVLAMV
jgi:hypothetical protein